MNNTIKFKLKDHSIKNEYDVQFLASLLKHTSISIELLKNDQNDELLFSWNDRELQKNKTRNAGAHKKEMNEFMPLVTDIKARIKETNAETVAKELGISRRTLFYRLKEAERNGYSSLF